MITFSHLFEISSVMPISPIGGYGSYAQKKPAEKKSFTKEQLTNSKFEQVMKQEQKKIDLKV
jgi:hypothetical protein